MKDKEKKVLQKYAVWNPYTRDEKNIEKRRGISNQSETMLVCLICSGCSAPGCGGCGSCAGCGSCTGA